MFKNNNSKVIKNIASASMKSNKMRNYFIGSIIIIATFLLTFTIIFSYNNTIDLQAKTKYHVSFENMNNDGIENISKNSDISKYGINKYGGIAKSKNVSLSMMYSDENSMDLLNIKLKEGRVPQKFNEIILEREYLELLNLNVNVGDKITLDYYDKENSSEKKDFIVTGFIETSSKGTKDRKLFSGIVSEEFIKSDISLESKPSSVLIQIANSKDYSNGDLKNKIKKTGESLGISENDMKINHLNIDSNNINPETKFVAIIVGFLVLSSCSIVIYNIFYISIARKVKDYGQLRTIGATKKQIKKIIFREGNILSIKYIPFGILLGCLTSYLIQPLIWSVVTSLILAILSGGIVLLTVRISIIKPAKVASNISPIEASIYTGNLNKNNIKSVKGRLTPNTLSKLYIKRNRKKAIITFVSLGLSGMLFMTIASIMSSVNVSEWTKQGFPKGGQYIISLNNDILSSEYNINNLQKENSLSNELKEKILSINGVEGVETHKYILGSIDNNDSEENHIDIDGISENDNNIEKFLVEGRLPNVSSKSSEMIINKSATGYNSFGLDYKVGDKIDINIFEGEEKTRKEFVICGIIEDKENGRGFMMHNKTMDNITSINTNYSFEILSNKKNSQEVESSLRNLVEYEEKISFLSLEEETNHYKKVFSTIITTIYIFTLLIVCFGIINLINTITTNILTRKNEFSIMQSIGLTRKQLIKMINIENFYMVFGSILIAVLGGGVLGYKLCKQIENIGGLSYVQYKFPLLLIILYIAVAFLIQVLISRFVGKTIKKQSLVERLKDI